MKKQKLTVWQWIKSLFVKSKIENEAKESIFPEIKWDEKNEAIKTNVRSFSVNEIPKKVFSNKVKTEIVIQGKTYSLTEKQLIFYNSIVNGQKIYLEGVQGGKIVYDFVKEKHNLSDSEMKEFKKRLFKINEHKKTMAYLLSSGLVTKIKGKYKAMV